MRTHKYRAWNKEKLIMIEDYKQDWAQHYDLKLGSILHHTVWFIGQYYKTLMQFTGLKDKDGTEAFESDYVIDQWGCIYEVKFGIFNNHESYEDHISGNGFYLQFKNGIDDMTDYSDLKIIGNIYQNQELLK